MSALLDAAAEFEARAAAALRRADTAHNGYCRDVCRSEAAGWQAAAARLRELALPVQMKAVA